MGDLICLSITVSGAASSWPDKDARIAELEAALAARDTLIDTLRVQLAQLRRMTFGQSSETEQQQVIRGMICPATVTPDRAA